jgi:hypothetical protein
VLITELRLRIGLELLRLGERGGVVAFREQLLVALFDCGRIGLLRNRERQGDPQCRRDHEPAEQPPGLHGHAHRASPPAAAEKRSASSAAQ